MMSSSAEGERRTLQKANMTSQYFFVFGTALVILLLFLIRKLASKKQYWEQYGIQTIKMKNIIYRTLKKETFVVTDAATYKQLGDLKYGGLQEAGFNICFVKDLDLFKQITVKDFDYFVNKRNFSASEKIWNDMLLNKHGKEWKDLRATMTPTFSTGKIRRMFPLLKESADKFSVYVKKIIDTKQEIDIEDALGRYCLDGICSLGFGIDSGIFKDKNSLVAEKADKLGFRFNNSTFIFMFIFKLMPKWLKSYQPTLLNPEGIQFFSKILLDTINYREKTKERRNDFLQLLIDAKHGQLVKDDDDEKLDANEQDALLKDKNTKAVDFTNDLILANCMLFIFGGFDTTKSAVAFAAYSLALNPNVQEKLRNELQSAMDENGGEFSYDMCNTHEYLDKVAREVMRRYPPGVRLERLCTKDYPIPNTKSFIPKGSIIIFPAYQIHHDEKHFPDPFKFDPERFSTEENAKRHPYAYMTFGHGPRNCIASRFAMVQTKAAIFSLVMNFHLEPTAKTPIPLSYANNGNLKPGEPLNIKVTPIP